ncbi:ricin-type beta-trefoil lectin domain protein [Glycomyces sp. NPDC049804]|uniref:ricin-type beta-trefoil lectin domain protein n=1 Tax=Glycomyces sp. NPDC049804 TaxID=3154363 RepID=UPI0034423C93
MKPTAQVRRALMLATAIVIAAVGVLAVPAPAQAGTFSSDITGVTLAPTGHPGLCVTATSTQSSAPLRLRPCGEDDALQQWTVTADDRILLTSNPSRCVGNPNNAGSQDTSLALTSSCSAGANNATWPYRLAPGFGAPAGAFMNSYSGVCMTVRDGNFAEGEWVVRRTCGSGDDYQRFSIGSADMQVSAVANPTGTAGATVQAQLRIENLGPQTAYRNSLALTAETGLRLGSVQRFDAASTGYAACTVTSDTAGSCAADGAWPSGGTGTVSVNATIPQDAAPGAVYQVCGTNTLAPANDGDAGNDSACAEVTVAHRVSNLAMADTVTGRQTAGSEVEPGAAVQIPFTLVNHGPDTAGVPKVAFEMPAAFTLTGLTTPASGWTCVRDTRTCTGPADAFANTATAAFTVAGTIASGLGAGDALGDVTATASVSGASRDTESGDDTATTTLTADPDVTVDVAKTGAATADPGGPIEYTVTVDNTGATGLVGASVSDPVPADISVTSWSCTATGAGACGTASGTGNDIATTVDVPAGGQAVITISGTVATAAAGTTVTNAATVTMPAGIGGRSVTGSADTTVTDFTDLAATSAPVTLAPGTSGTVTTTVRNEDLTNAAGAATVTLDFPDGVTVSDLDARCTDNGDGTATCTIPAATLTAGASTDLAFTAALPADTATGTVFTGSAAIGYALDDDAGDNTADLTVTAGDPVVDFGISASDAETVVPGETGTVTFTLSNSGPSTTDTTTTATLRAPPAATWDGGQPAECTATADRELTCTLPAGAAPGSETELTLAYTVDAAAQEGTAAGTGLVHNDHDTTTANDTAEWQIAIAPPAADLRIDKTAANGSVTPGDQFDYTLTVHNDGPSSAVDATVTDALPPQLTYVAATGTGATCEASGQTVTCAYASIAPGTRTITLTAQIDPAYTGTGTDLPNSAAATASTADPDTANNTSGTVNPAVGAAAADLALTKQTTTGAPVAPGETFTYLLEAANSGPSTATGAIVTDDLPAALAFVSSESGCTGTAGEYGGSVTCAPGTIAVGGEVELLVTVQLDPAYTGTGSDAAVTNTAAIGADTSDPDAGNNAPAAGLPGGTVAAGRADLSVATIASTADAVAPGETVAYTITVANDGPSTATGIDVGDTLPSGTVFASSPDGCTAAGQTVTCPQIASLAPGAAVAFEVRANVDPAYTGDGGDLANAATAASPNIADPDTANNTGSVPLAAGGVTAPSADLAISKSGAGDTGGVAPGETFTYTLTVTNHGPSDAADVAVTDDLPAPVAFESADGCTGTGGLFGGTVTCGPLAALPAAPGSNTVEYVLTVRLNPVYAGIGTDVVNAASVTAATADPDSADNSTDLSGVPSLAAGSADLAVDKTVVGSPTVAPGETFDYRISVSNAGPSVSVNPTVTDTLGDGMSWEAHPSGCTVDGPTLTCPPGALGSLQLPVLGTASFDTTVRVDPGFGTGTLTNTATVAADTADPDSADNSVTVTGGVTVSAASADLDTTTTLVTAGEVPPGGTLEYAIAVHNAGPSDAADVTTVDELPAGLTFAGAPNDACAADGQTVTCAPSATIAAGETVSRVFRATVDPAYTGSGADLGNSATATAASTADPDPADNTSPEVFPSIGAPSADLRMTKQLNTTGAVVPGGTFQYALTVENQGPSVAANAVLTDTLDGDLAFVSSTPDECTASGQTVTCAHAEALPVESHTWVLTVRLSPDYTGDGSDIANTAAVAADTADPQPANNTGTAAAGTLTVAAPSADVALTAAAVGAAAVAPGESFDYALTVANAGPSTATGIAVSDTLPAGIAFVSSGDCIADGQNLDCATVDSLAVGAQAAYTVTVRVDPGYTGTGDDLVNTATATPATADPDPADNTGTATVPGGAVAAPRADVRLTNAVVGTDPIVPGSAFDYTLTVANAGPSTATGIAVTDTLPAGIAFVSSGDCTADTDLGATVTCATVDSLAVGAEAAYTVTVRLDPTYTGTGDDLVNTATATPATADPDTANNTGTATVPGGSVAAPEAAVSIAKTGGGPVVAGSAGELTITVSNAGPSAAQDVTVTDTLSTGLSFASATGAACTADSDIVTCPIGTLNAGDQVAFTVVLGVDAAAADGSVLTAAAEVATSTANTSGDTTASADLAVAAEAGVSLAKTPPASMTAGGEAVYAFTVQNQGPSDATGVSLAGALDPSLAFVSAAGATCSVAGSNLTCEVGTVADGATASVEVTVRVGADTPAGTRIGLTAALTTATANTSPDTTAVATGPPVSASADLAASITNMRATPVVPGEAFAYRLRAINNGPSVAAGTVVTDQLPRALAFVSSPDGCTGDPGVYRGAVVTCRADGALEVGESAEFTVMVRLHPALPGNGSRVLSRATAASDTPDPVSTNNTRSARLPTGAAAAPLADLSIVKTLDATGPVTPGDTFTYSITIANAGPSAAAGVTLTDTLPDPLTWVQADSGASSRCQAEGQTITCNTSALIPVGFSRTLTMTVTLDPAYTGDGSDLVNSASISSATADPQPGDNTTTADAVPVDAPSGDLMLTQGFAAFPGSQIVPGQTTDNLLSLNNYGISTATNVVVSHQLPPELAFVSSFDGCTGEPGVYGGTITCPTIDRLEPDESVFFIVTVRLKPDYIGDGSDIDSNANVDSSNDDPAEPNNTAPADMDGGVSAPRSDLSITKTAPDAMIAGREATWTIEVGNSGPSTATGVTVTDELDPDTEFVSASPDVCSAAGGRVTCDLGSLDPGATAAIDLTVMVDGEVDSGTTIANTASVAAETDPEGDTGTAVGPPVRVVTDLAIVKEFDPDTAGPVTPGTDFGYLVTIENTGQAESAENVTFTESLPAALDFVEATDADTGERLDCDTADDSVACHVAAVLEPGASVMAAVTVRLDPSYRGGGDDVTNTVGVSSDAVDPNGENDTASATGVPGGVGDPVYERMVTVTEGRPAPPGGTTTVDVAVETTGPSTMDDPVTVTIGMPEHVGAVGAELPSECADAGRDAVVCTIDADAAPRSEAAATRRAEAAVAEASPVERWTASITLAVDDDAAPSTYLAGGIAELNTDPNDPDGTTDAIAWGVRTAAGGGPAIDAGSIDGGLVTTGGDSLAIVLTGVGAIVTGLVITAAVTRRRGARR